MVQAKLLEHNVRFGDPECQNLMLRLESDLLEVLLAACDGTLAQVQLQWSQDAALTVVMAAKGYPGGYKKGSVIRGLDNVSTAKVGVAYRAVLAALHVACRWDFYSQAGSVYHYTCCKVNSLVFWYVFFALM